MAAFFLLLCFLSSCATRARSNETPEPSLEQPRPFSQVHQPASALSPTDWSPTEFDQFSRIRIANTARPWLNVIGNGLFGGNYLYLLSNRGDGREFRINVEKNAATHTNLSVDFSRRDPIETIHGIGYSTLYYTNKGAPHASITYFIEPDDKDSEIWMLQNPAKTEIHLQHGSRRSSFTDQSLALQILGFRLQEIPFAVATERLQRAQKRWQEYITIALQRMGIAGVSNRALMREFIWDIYQVAATVTTDRFKDPDGTVRLRNTNMGATYTFMSMDVHGRDSLQMIPAVSTFDPQVARECILNSARYQDKSGRIFHRRMLSGQPMDRGHSDENYWLILATSEYISHTKDLSLLSEKAPYLDNELISEYILFKNPEWVKKFEARQLEPARFSSTQTSILEHLRRALINIPLGPHGLPLMEDGDWNDALNGLPAGESVMNAGLYAYSLVKLKELYKMLGEQTVNAIVQDGAYGRDLRHFDDLYRAMKEATNRYAWDGEWFVRGFDNQGAPFGSHQNDEGKIYLEPQAWAILAGIPDVERTQKILASVGRYLIKADKVSLLAPVYTRKNPNIGAITLLPKGSNENGGQWRQCTLWWIAALREIGKDQQAMKLLNAIVLANADPVVMGTEPYLYNEYIRGPEAVNLGSGGQQAHVQQAALVLHMLAHSYPQVNVTRNFIQRFDYPGVTSEATLKTITGHGELVDWAPKWVDDPPKYELVRLTPSH